MTSVKSEEGWILFPWVMRDAEALWNTDYSQKFKFRTYTDDKSNSS